MDSANISNFRVNGKCWNTIYPYIVYQFYLCGDIFHDLIFLLFACKTKKVTELAWVKWFTVSTEWFSLEIFVGGMTRLLRFGSLALPSSTSYDVETSSIDCACVNAWYQLSSTASRDDIHIPLGECNNKVFLELFTSQLRFERLVAPPQGGLQVPRLIWERLEYHLTRAFPNGGANHNWSLKTSVFRYLHEII